MESEDDMWAKALHEAGSAEDRDAGLWARCFAEADGDEAKAKAAYIRRRVEQWTPAPTTGACPNCTTECPLDARLCESCGECFSSEHRPIPAGTNRQNYRVAGDERPSADAAAPTVVMIPKSRGVYIILGLFLGTLGIHNFYAGRYTPAVFQLFLTAILGWVVIGLVITAVWALMELIFVTNDGDGRRMA